MPTRKPKKTSTKSASQISGYISNPFTLFTSALRAVFQFNLNNLLAFVAVGIGSIALFVILVFAVRQLIDGIIFGIFLATLIAVAVYWAVVLLAAFNKYALITAANKKLKFKQLIKIGHSKAGGFLAVMALNAVIVLGGMVLLIIPGVIFLYWFFLAPFIYIDQKVTPIEALKKSRQLMRGQPIEFFGLLATSWLFALPGYIPVIGTFYQFFYGGAYNVAWAQRYQSTKSLVDKNQKLPSTDKYNLWIIWAGAIAVLLGIIFAIFYSGNK